jgi:hypothetical protein
MFLIQIEYHYSSSGMSGSIYRGQSWPSSSSCEAMKMKILGVTLCAMSTSVAGKAFLQRGVRRTFSFLSLPPIPSFVDTFIYWMDSIAAWDAMGMYGALCARCDAILVFFAWNGAVQDNKLTLHTSSGKTNYQHFNYTQSYSYI